MKRSALKRKTPMRRVAMRRQPKSTSYARRERDFLYMGWVKQQRCFIVQMEEWRRRREHPAGDVMLGLWLGPLAFGSCRGVIEAHHAGQHGTGKKASDDTCIPLCEAHHRGDDVGITRLRGAFAGWPRGSVKAWEVAAAAYCHGVYVERSGDGPLF